MTRTFVSCGGQVNLDNGYTQDPTKLNNNVTHEPNFEKIADGSSSQNLELRRGDDDTRAKQRWLC